MADLPLPEKITALDETLKQAGIAHAFGGALALAYYAEPRTTNDIDINLFLEVDEYRSVIRLLRTLGIEGPDDTLGVERDGQVRTWWGRNPVDLFFAYDPFHEAMREAARTVPFGEAKLPVLGPEHLVVCKAAFDRPKDWLDIEQVFVATDVLDGDEIWVWMDRFVGTADERYRRLRELWDQSRGS